MPRSGRGNPSLSRSTALACSSGIRGGNLMLQDSHNAQLDVITYTADDASMENRYFRFRR
jgi:hypothetical protein